MCNLNVIVKQVQTLRCKIISNDLAVLSTSCVTTFVSRVQPCWLSWSVSSAGARDVIRGDWSQLPPTLSLSLLAAPFLGIMSFLRSNFRECLLLQDRVEKAPSLHVWIQFVFSRVAERIHFQSITEANLRIIMERDVRSPAEASSLALVVGTFASAQLPAHPQLTFSHILSAGSFYPDEPSAVY